MSNPYRSSTSEWYKTYLVYLNQLHNKSSYSYNAWKRLPESLKAICLYVNFYDEITLAWNKVKTKWVCEQDGIEVINQYMIKNVSKIENDKKRFDPKYIYRVSWNCLYCLCIDPSSKKDSFENELSSDIETDEGTTSFFNLLGYEDDYETNQFVLCIDNWYSSLDEVLQIYTDYLLHEITQYQALRQLKKLNVISGNIKLLNNRDSIMDQFIFEFHPKIIENLKQYINDNSISFDFNLKY